VPISLATTFAQASPGVPSGRDSGLSYGKGFEYSRTGNPTRAAFEQAVAAAEHAKYAVAFASGMAATTTLIHLLKQGDHVVSIDDVYGGTQRYFRRVVAPTYGINFDFVDFNKPGELEAAIKPNTRMIWLETPTNPTLKIADIAAAAVVAKRAGALLVVDNTFMSPFFQVSERASGQVACEGRARARRGWRLATGDATPVLRAEPIYSVASRPIYPMRLRNCSASSPAPHHSHTHSHTAHCRTRWSTARTS
jgi:cystathionine gamma-lyase